MSKIKVNMLGNNATKIKAQGVGSAFLELVDLLSKNLGEELDIYVNEKNIKADIYHHHTLEADSFIKLFTSNFNNNVVYVHYLPDTLEGSIKLPDLALEVFKKYVIKYYQKADYLVVVNPIFIDKLVELEIDREKIFYIPNYVSADNFYKLDKKEIDTLKEKYQISRDRFTVLGVGQVQTRKGVKEFIEVAKALPNINFIWAGGFSFGSITDGYKDLELSINNAPNNVKFLGIIEREDMNQIYNIADLLFLPSYNELFPMAILETINLNKPILLRDLELYQPILFNYYYKASDNQGFIEQIDQIANNIEYYSQGCKNSMKLQEIYSKETILKTWLDFYRMVYQNLQVKPKIEKELK